MKFAADDFDAIAARMEELKDSRIAVCEERAASDGPFVTRRKAMEALRNAHLIDAGKWRDLEDHAVIGPRIEPPAP